MALLRLAADWAAKCAVDLHALTVDHGLREAASVEARQVCAWLKPLGIAHTVLQWHDGPRWRSGVASAQAPARAARYALMTDWCRTHGYDDLLLGHHADDQAETFLLRLTRGSGVDGLAAMAPVVARDGIRLLRPLLAYPKERLRAYCRAVNQPWIEDPSNDDMTYGRVRFRDARDLLAREGFSDDRLRATAHHMQRARSALTFYVEDLLSRACIWDRFGVARLVLSELLRVPEEIGLRTVAAILKTASGQVYPPRFERLKRLYDALCRGPWQDATLRGCCVVRQGAHIIFYREAAQIADTQNLVPGVAVLWDGRFRVRLTDAQTDFRIARFVPADAPDLLRDVPAAVRKTLPAVLDSHGLAVLPHADYVRADLVAGREGLVTIDFVGLEKGRIPEIDAEL